MVRWSRLSRDACSAPCCSVSAASQADGFGDRAGVMVSTVALAASLGAAAMLLSAGLRAAAELRGAKAALVTSIPVGTLAGWNARTGSEWVPLPGMNYKVVLFGSNPSGSGVDIRFWSDVAAKVNELSPAIQFVALCASGTDCRVPDGGATNLTLLSAMDPMQMQALAMHGKRGEAIIHSGSGVRTPLAIEGSGEALAARIVSTFQRMEKAGGA